MTPGQAGLGHSVFGITANSAIGLLGLLLFINILRVSHMSHVVDFTFESKTNEQVAKSKLDCLNQVLISS